MKSFTEIVTLTERTSREAAKRAGCSYPTRARIAQHARRHLRADGAEPTDGMVGPVVQIVCELQAFDTVSD